MSDFSKPSVGLQTLFPSSGREVPRPRELTDVVHLVHPFPSQASDLQTSTRNQQTGAAAVTPFVLTANVPDGFFDEWVQAHVSHSFGAATRLELSIVDPIGQLIQMAAWQFDNTVNAFLPVFLSGVFVNGAFASPTMILAAPRPILVPPGWHLQLAGATQGAAYTVTLQGLALRRPLADVPLHRG